MPNNKDERIALRLERVELEKQKRKELNALRTKRDVLLVNLEIKLNKSKIKEKKLKEKIKVETRKENNLILKEKAEDRTYLSSRRKDITLMKKEMAADKVATKKEVDLINQNIRTESAKLKSKNVTKNASLKSKQRDQRIKNREAIAKIKAETLEDKIKAKKVSDKKKAKIRKMKLKAAQELAEDRRKIEAESSTLRNQKFEKKAVAKAARLKRLAEARERNEEIRLAKEQAKIDHRSDVAQVKAKRINGKQSVEEIKKIDEIEAEEELNEIVLQTIEIEAEAEIIKEEAETLIEEDKLEIEEFEPEVEEYEPEYGEAFEEGFEEELKAEEKTQVDSYLISSFGKVGLKRLNKSREDATEDEINKYKRSPTLYKNIEEYRKQSLIDSVKLETLFGYSAIAAGIKVSKEDQQTFHNHMITALLMDKTIMFGNGYLVPSRMSNKTLIKYQEDIEVSYIETINEPLAKELNKLIVKKIKAGTKIIITDGLMVHKDEDKQIVALQDTNFLKV